MQPPSERISGNQRSRGRAMPRISRSVRLHRADRMQHVEIGVGDDVGRHRERQEQRPFEDASAGKAEHGDEPGRADADRRVTSTPTPRSSRTRRARSRAAGRSRRDAARHRRSRARRNRRGRRAAQHQGDDQRARRRATRNRNGPGASMRPARSRAGRQSSSRPELARMRPRHTLLVEADLVDQLARLLAVGRRSR